MLTPKKQGFIIRKTKNIQSDREQRSKMLSQTQLPKIPRSQRSPGSILQIKFKEDVGVIKRTNFYEDPEIEQSRFPSDFGFQYKYQEITNDLKQKEDVEEQHNKSFEELSQSSFERTYGVNVKVSFGLLRELKKLNFAIQHRSSSIQTLSTSEEYFEFINNNETANVSQYSIPNYRKKLLKDSLLYQRISVVLLCFIEGIVGKFSQVKSYLLNLNTYSIENLLLRLAILTKGHNSHINELLKEQKRENFLNKGFDTIKNNNQIMAQAINKVSKCDNLFHENLKKIMKNNKTMHVQEQMSAILEYFSFFIHVTEKTDKIPFLAIAPAPFLPDLQFPKYTLIIDVLQVFCSKNKKAIQNFRPFSQYFLDQMSQYYEIVSFCDGMPNQVNKIINFLDRKNQIKHRLYRYHLDKFKSFKGKDLSKIGRNLENVVLLDTCVQMDEDNTIIINSWKGKKNDADLAELCPLLALIALKKLNVQKAVKRIQQKMDENQKLGIKYLNCGLDLREESLEE